MIEGLESWVGSGGEGGGGVTLSPTQAHPLGHSECLGDAVQVKLHHLKDVPRPPDILSES